MTSVWPGSHPSPLFEFDPSPVAVIALGATQIIGCGGAGVVQPGFDIGHVIVPTGAVRFLDLGLDAVIRL